MSYESSYDTSGGPFRPNKDRGLWSRSSDFVFACLCNVVRMDCLYGTAIVPFIASGGILTFISCTLSVLLYSLPIVFIQTFLGQFSSSGFISVFRISPLFKGLGYIGLVVNLFSLAFFSIFAAIPLLIFFHSLQPTMPWSCEGFLNDYKYNYTHCSIDFSAVHNDTFIKLSVPSVEYFVNILSTFSFSLFGCVLAIWIPVAFALYSSTETIGRIFRYCTITLCSLLLVVFVRMAFIPSAKESLLNGFAPATDVGWRVIIFGSPMLMMASFGPGWGTVLSLASYNKFKANVTKSSLMICFSQFGAMFLIGLIFAFTEAHLTDNNSNTGTAISTSGYHWINFLAIPSSLASLEYPHLWTWMFLAVLVIGSFNLVIVQMFSVLTALFDEFEQLRMYRKEVIFGISGFLALVSAVFCTENGIAYIEIVSNLSILSQALLNLILLLVVVWIYGRERFQRDLEFMTSQVLATWKVFVVRFVTPLFLFMTLFIVFVLMVFDQFSYKDTYLLVAFTVPLQILLWLILPGYCVYKLLQTTGPIGLRFKRCTRPNDWYPIDPEDRQRYDETVNVSENSHHLTAIVL